MLSYISDPNGEEEEEKKKEVNYDACMHLPQTFGALFATYFLSYHTHYHTAWRVNPSLRGMHRQVGGRWKSAFGRRRLLPGLKVKKVRIFTELLQAPAASER